MEVRVMQFFSLDRGITVALCFVLWIGAAGLVCWALLPTQMPVEPAMGVNPASVVREARGELTHATLGSGVQISMAQR
jgi:hypothetical protein